MFEYGALREIGVYVLVQKGWVNRTGEICVMRSMTV
jgi:hypothetical protein